MITETMSDTQNPLQDRTILELIRSICEKGESGRLEILAGAIQGELSFKDGKLVDARVGHLTGFRAINAAASMRDARASFDPAFTPIACSGITASERVVLKQFFGIETTDAYLVPAVMSWPEETAQILNSEPESEVADEVTIVRSNGAPSPSVVLPLPPPRSRFSYPTAIALAAVVIAVMAAASVLLFKLRSRNASAVVTNTQSPIPVADAAPVQLPDGPVVQSAPAQSAPASRDLSGKWSIVNTVETTSYRSFKNLKVGFDLSINQNGTNFTGSGQKISENGHTLPADSRTPIQLKGTIKGDRIEATFFEEGTARKTNGRFVWRIDRAGRGLTGTFASTAARSRGKSAATREL
jgi:hypothetical protein